MTKNQRLVFVGGGARGIGEATVRAFAANGDSVVFSDVADDAGAALAAELSADGHEVSFHRADMTDEAVVAALFATISGDHGSIDVATNVVGNIGGGDRAGTLLHE